MLYQFREFTLRYIKFKTGCRGLFTMAFMLALMSAPALASNARVAVASNFSYTAKALQTRFEQATEHKLTYIFGASGKLYAQIRHGAPFDVLLSADSKTARLLTEQKLALTNSQFTYAHGQLALWVPASIDPVTPNHLVTAPAAAKLAIANPKLAPYGLAATELIQNLAPTNRAQQVVGENISQTFQFVATGNAELGLVAYSQLVSQQVPPNQYWLAPQGSYSDIQQDAVLLTTGRNNQAARDFLDFLKSDEAKAIIRSHGYRID